MIEMHEHSNQNEETNPYEANILMLMLKKNNFRMFFFLKKIPNQMFQKPKVNQQHELDLFAPRLHFILVRFFFLIK